MNSYPKGSKEPKSLKTERVHLNNFNRIVGQATALHTIRGVDVQRYIDQRLVEKGNRGGTIKSDTVRKELQTFRLLWKYARRNGNVYVDCPVDGVARPKRRQKPPFQTWEQIMSAIGRGGVGDEQVKELWDGLYLREIEVAAFLENVRRLVPSLPRFAYAHAALSFCAYPTQPCGTGPG